jgi:hypothetical protein
VGKCDPTLTSDACHSEVGQGNPSANLLSRLKPRNFNDPITTNDDNQSECDRKQAQWYVTTARRCPTDSNAADVLTVIFSAGDQAQPEAREQP